MVNNATEESNTLLIADDNPDDRMLARVAFKKSRLSCELNFVEDGAELMDYLYHRGKYSGLTSHPRLILLDLNMPNKSGYEALEEIKSEPCLRKIPVVVLSDAAEEEDIASHL